MNELRNLLSQINRLVEAYQLLNRIYIAFGPYSKTATIDDELHQELNKFFVFDDSE